MSKRRADAMLLFHGAGSDRNHPTLLAVDKAAASVGLHIERLNFPYRQQTSGRRPPDRMPKLVGFIEASVDSVSQSRSVPKERIVIGGHSMGGRACSVAHAEGLTVAGLALFSYPLHPPRKPDKLRVDHFPGINKPVLLIQGQRDPFGTPAEFQNHLKAIPTEITEHWLDGDHDLTAHAGDIGQLVVEWLRA